MSALNAVLAYDWAKFLRERLDNLNRDPLDGITRGGYQLMYNDAAGKYYESEETLGKVTELTCLIGLSVDKDGKVKSVLWDGPSEQVCPQASKFNR